MSNNNPANNPANTSTTFGAALLGAVLIGASWRQEDYSRYEPTAAEVAAAATSAVERQTSVRGLQGNRTDTLIALAAREEGVSASARGLIKAARGSVRPLRNWRDLHGKAGRARYGHIVRGILRARGVDVVDVDSRLLAAGTGQMSPSAFAARWEGFYEFWQACARRPGTVGSCHNKAAPEVALAAKQAGWPAWAVEAMGDFLGRNCPRWKPSVHIPAARAARRASLRQTWIRNWLSIKALSALGRVSAGCQRWVLRATALDVDRWYFRYANPRYRTNPRYQSDRPLRLIRVRDLDWSNGRQWHRATLRGAAKIGAAKLILDALLNQYDADGTVHHGAMPKGWASPQVRQAMWMIGLDGGSSVWDRARKEAVRRLAGAFGDQWRANGIEPHPWCGSHVPWQIERVACLIALGNSPRAIAKAVGDVDLSKAEAHDWITTSPGLLIEEWRLRSLNAQLPDGVRVRSAAVAEWLLDLRRRGGWGQLTKVREVHGPGGMQRTVRLIETVDEIQDEDLIDGRRTSVQAAFDAAGRRMAAAYEEGKDPNRELCSPQPSWPFKPRSFGTWLTTPAMLRTEGKWMNHCVGGYVPAVERGQSRILSIAVRDGQGGFHRSTVEFNRYGDVLQHRTARNKPPHELCVRALNVMLRRR